MGSSRQRRLEPLRRERDAAQAHARCAEDGVGDGRAEIGGHDRGSPAQKGERVGLHPRISHWKQFRDPMFALLDQHVNRIAPAPVAGPIRPAR
jgi:hypothetical protein